MSLKTYRFLFILLFLPFVYADSFNLTGCDNVMLGVNSLPPIDVYSDYCESVTDRVYDCECKEGVITLYSKDHTKEYDLVFEYEIDNVPFRKRFDNYVFKEEYSNTFLNTVLFYIIFIFVLIIIIPVIWIYNAVK